MRWCRWWVWWMGRASEVGMAHIAGHKSSTVDVAATSGSDYFSFLSSGSFWAVHTLGVRREGSLHTLREWWMMRGVDSN